MTILPVLLGLNSHSTKQMTSNKLLFWVCFFFLSQVLYLIIEISIQRRNGLEKICAQGLRHIAIGTYVPYFLLLNLSSSCVYMYVCMSEQDPQIGKLKKKIPSFSVN